MAIGVIKRIISTIHAVIMAQQHLVTLVFSVLYKCSYLLTYLLTIILREKNEFWLKIVVQVYIKVDSNSMPSLTEKMCQIINKGSLSLRCSRM